MTDDFRKCGDCGNTKSASDFGYNARAGDGLASYCKSCFSERRAASYRRRQAALGKSVRERVEVPEGYRWCPTCEKIKILADFPRSRAEKSGYASYCKPCHNRKGREVRERLYGGTRHYHLKRRYGLADEDVRQLISDQGGLCPICLSAPADQVDHDHATGAVRAVLCFNCNGGLGQFKDQPDVLRRAAKYLEGDVWRPISIVPGVYQLPI